MSYTAVFTEQFEKEIKFLKKEHSLALRVEKKIFEILENPEHYKPLRNILKGKRRAHVGSYVIIYEIVKDQIVFHTFIHHDQAYEN